MILLIKLIVQGGRVRGVKNYLKKETLEYVQITGGKLEILYIEGHSIAPISPDISKSH